MPDTKITALTELAVAPAATDKFVLVDVSDTTMAPSGTDKCIQFTNLGLVQQAGDEWTGRMWRDDFGTDLFDDTTSFLGLRRRADNPSGNAAVMNVAGWVTGTTSIADRLNGIFSSMSDGTVVNKTITNMTRVGTTVSVSANAHGFTTGAHIAVYGVTHTFNAEVNGAWVVANPSTNSFDITVPGLSSGAYGAGGTATNRPMYYAISGLVGPILDRGGLTGTAVNADDTAAFVGYNAGTAKSTDCYYAAANPAIVGSAFNCIYSADANSDYHFYSGRNVLTAGFWLNATYTGPGLLFAGTFNSYGIDFKTGSNYTSGMIRFKNDAIVVGRNAADAADVEMFRFNTINETQFTAAVRFNGNAALAAATAWSLGEGMNFVSGTATGTKIGTATSQKIGFWNTTPVGQPSVTATTGTFAAGTGTAAVSGSSWIGNTGTKAYTVSDIISALKSAGIMAA